MPHNEMRGCVNICSFVMFSIIFFISIPMVFLPLGTILHLDDHMCYINDIEYPTVEPEVNSDGWIECSCGSNCETFKPCIKLFTNLSDEIFMTESVYKSNSPCTFYDDDNCNEITNYPDYLNTSYHTYTQYMNKTVLCYHSENGITGIYFNNDINYVMLVLLSVILTIVILVCICNNYSCIKKEICKCRFISENQRVVTTESVIHEVKIIHNPMFDTVIDIPLVKLSKQEKKEQCVICLEQLKKNVIKLNCDHLIHKKCWDQWNQQDKKTCPICRAEQ